MEASRTKICQTLLLSHDKHSNNVLRSIWKIEVSVGVEIALSAECSSLLEAKSLNDAPLADPLIDQRPVQKALHCASLGA
jgi:hypothetical protein